MSGSMRSMSAAGLTALRQHEGTVLKYYNDAAGNCTFGVGTLAHHGQCSEDELARPVTEADIMRDLTRAVAHAESAVRRQVGKRELTQQQFDALVSFVYNTGARRAGPVLAAAQRGDDSEVARLMAQYVYIHPRDRQGRRLAPQRLQGLVIRRLAESAPFRQ